MTAGATGGPGSSQKREGTGSASSRGSRRRTGDPLVFARGQHLRARRTMVWAVALALLACVLAFVPLFDTLGFELAFAMAIAASFASADLGATFVRRVRDAGGTVERSPGRLVLVMFLRAAAINLALLVPPLILISLNAVRVRTCAWGDGLLFYALLPGLSSMWATGVGMFAALCAGRHRKLSNALPHIILIALVVIALWRFYSAPPVFSYSPLAGYFPGNLYDEQIDLASPFFWARAHAGAWLLCTLAAVAALLDPATL
ncbi:MAG TPA: hypothetical protein VFG83_03380, partial [Kofleriaceae bacterium]|nr:hypothetical protein [Kofleriaceae bacterium]